MKEVVAFAYKSPHIPDGRMLSGRVELFDMLKNRGLVPVVTLGGEAAFKDEDVVAARLVSEQGTLDIGRKGLHEVGVMVNRLDRSIKKDQIPAPELLPPLINENETRSLAHRKDRMHSEVLGPLGFGIPTILPRTASDVEAFMSEHTGASFIVKPNDGYAGIGVASLDRTGVRRSFALDGDNFGKMIVQPEYDFTGPMPLQPYDNAAREAFEGWNNSDARKEVRVYGFHSPLATRVFPVARAIDMGDNWFFVDPECVPADVTDGAIAAMQRTAELTGAAAVYGSVDFGYGAVEVSEQPQWRVIEVNAKAPYMLGYDKHEAIADHLRQLFSDQIFETALSPARGRVGEWQ